MPAHLRSRAAFGRLSTLLLASALAAPALPSSEAAAAPPYQPYDGPMPQIDTTPKPMRLRAKVKMVKTSDSSEGPGNTEDEVYFSLAGIRKVGGVETVLNRRTVRPGISRDFWEMGNATADDFHATIFEGKLGKFDRTTMALLVQEQDNKTAQQLAQILALAGGHIYELLIADAAAGDQATDIGLEKLQTEITKIITEMKQQGDELIGGVELVVQGNSTLKVKAPSQASAKLISSTSKSAVVELTGAGGKYRVELVLEDQSAPKQLTQTYLSREQDQCGQEKLWVEKKGGGNKLVLKGDGNVQVRVKDDVFHWHCGDLDEDDQTNAPNETKMVEVTRSSTGGTIKWDCYHEKTAVPQYTW